MAFHNNLALLDRKDINRTLAFIADDNEGASFKFADLFNYQ